MNGQLHGRHGLCRFEPGEFDDYPDAFDHPPRRIAEDEPLFVLDP